MTPSEAEQHEEQIRLKKEEIHWMNVNYIQGDTIQKRILAVLEVQLAELERGMRKEGR